MLEVSEVFHSLQGEGPFTGKPAVFVRLSGCVEPLCPWCDSLHACSSGTMMSLDNINRRIAAFAVNLVVITGGEPFLQWRSGVQRLERQLLGKGFLVQYETGGKVAIPENVRGFVVCSPKFFNSRWLFQEVNLDRAMLFKFVADDNYEQIKAFVQHYRIAANRVLVMPEGATRRKQLAAFRKTWNFCLANGFGFSPRLHVLAFDDMRGV